jgi:hypothetical protein
MQDSALREKGKLIHFSPAVVEGDAGVAQLRHAAVDVQRVASAGIMREDQLYIERMAQAHARTSHQK